jgi:hypothetical protein
MADSTRLLVAENHLNILIDKKYLVLVGRASELYRQYTTDRLRAVLHQIDSWKSIVQVQVHHTSTRERLLCRAFLRSQPFEWEERECSYAGK